MATEREEQLRWEARAGRAAGMAAALAAVLAIAGNILLASALADRDDGDAGTLVTVDSESAAFLAAAVVTAAVLVLLIPVLGYLYRATEFRRPEVGRFPIVILVVGVLLGAGLSIATAVLFVDVASDFTAGAPRSGDAGEERADALVEDSPFRTIQSIGLAANLAVGFGVLLISLHAMRAGLLSRFMGILGIIVGVLYGLTPLTGGPQIVQLFWLGALAALFMGRWPGGRGPAWESGQADPWPTAAEQAQRREEQLQASSSEAAGGSGNGRGSGAAPESADPDVPRPSSRKRKRKKR